MSDTENGGDGNIEDSDAVVTDENGRVRFRTLRVNKGGGEGDDSSDDE